MWTVTICKEKEVERHSFFNEMLAKAVFRAINEPSWTVELYEEDRLISQKGHGNDKDKQQESC